MQSKGVKVQSSLDTEGEYEEFKVVITAHRQAQDKCTLTITLFPNNAMTELFPDVWYAREYQANLKSVRTSKSNLHPLSLLWHLRKVSGLCTRHSRLDLAASAAASTESVEMSITRMTTAFEAPGLAPCTSEVIYRTAKAKASPEKEEQTKSVPTARVGVSEAEAHPVSRRILGWLEE